MTALASTARPAFGLPGRIQAPNSTPRSLALVGLGDGGAAIARALQAEGAATLPVRVFAAPRPPADPVADALAAIKSNGDDLHRAVREADLVFVVACQGDDVRLAPVVSRLARERNIQVTAIYLVPGGEAAVAEDANLKVLRAGAQMVVVATDESYVAAMLAALAG